MRRFDIDAIKGFAIIGIVLFHLGFLKSSFLGADVLFAVSGYLAAASLCKHSLCGTATLEFLNRRLFRLLPLLSVATAFCLAVGFIGMLPDDYENLAESVFATEIFSNNILEAIRDNWYWGVINEYKPLMHTWFIGILAEYYVVFTCVAALCGLISKSLKVNVKLTISLALSTLTAISLYLHFRAQGDTFYFLQYRFYELSLGSLLAINLDRFKIKFTWPYPVFLLLLISLFLIGERSELFYSVHGRVWIISAVLLTLLLLACPIDGKIPWLTEKNILCRLGTMSYSIFIWHQILIAFYRYYISADLNVLEYVIYFTVLALISYGSYHLIERKLQLTTRVKTTTCISAFVILILSGVVYIRAGVVRDVPELEISTKDARRNMHAAYCDRIYEYNVDFPNNKKINVLIEGDSFGRDFANILLESRWADTINISYIFDFDEKYIPRIKRADIIFTRSPRWYVPDYVFENASDSVIYGIGSKKFGECNGNIYSRRFSARYYDTTVSHDDWTTYFNNEMKTSWGSHYIDMMKPVETADGKIRVFTPDSCFISQDCSHLTRAGARYYARLIDFQRFFEGISER